MSTDQPESARSARSSAGPRVVVDAVGGDKAPAEPVAGCIGAANRWQDTAITLVGPRDAVEAELDKHGPRPANIEVVHASEVIGMHESPVRALRGKRDSSINVGMKIVADGDADAFLSAGNTGAVVAAGSLRLGLMEGVQRPGIAVPMIAIDHPILVIDVGANVHCKPPHLLQYGLMADVFARNVMDMKNPRVGLLNVGEEERKGTELEKEAYGLLADAPLNFVGNVESDDVFFGGCDIVVCDGFVGNILLKTSESMVKKVLSFLREEISKKWRRRIGFALCKDVFESTRQVGDYAEYGGAPLLGVDGVTIICHGRSEARAFENAVREARSILSHKVNHSIGEAVRACLPSRQNAPESTRPAAS